MGRCESALIKQLAGDVVYLCCSKDKVNLSSQAPSHWPAR